MAGQEAAPAPPEGGAAREPGAAAQPAWRRNLLAFGHLAVLSAVRARAAALQPAVGQPGVLRRARLHGERDHRLRRAARVLVPPALLLAIELLVGPGRRAGPPRSSTWCSSALLAAVVFVQALKKAIDAADAAADRAGAGARRAGGAALYARAEPVRSFLSVLTPAPLVFLVIFLFISPVSKLTLAGEASAKIGRGRRSACRW